MDAVLSLLTWWMSWLCASLRFYTKTSLGGHGGPGGQAGQNEWSPSGSSARQRFHMCRPQAWLGFHRRVLWFAGARLRFHAPPLSASVLRIHSPASGPQPHHPHLWLSLYYLRRSWLPLLSSRSWLSWQICHRKYANWFECCFKPESRTLQARSLAVNTKIRAVPDTPIGQLGESRLWCWVLEECIQILPEWTLAVAKMGPADCY